MKIEFYTPAPGCYSGTSYYKVEGLTDYKPIDSLDLNTQNILYRLFIDNYRIHKYVIKLRANGIISILEIITRCASKFFPKLNRIWDIDETTLNIECN